MPEVNSLMAAIGSSALKSMTSAPCALVISSREGIVSIVIIRPTSNNFAQATQNCPTGPRPNTAIVFPGFIWAFSAAMYAVGTMSERRIAWSSSTSSGSFTKPTFANGTLAFSVCKPSKGPLLFGPPKNAVPASGPLGLALSHCAK